MLLTYHPPLTLYFKFKKNLTHATTGTKPSSFK